MSEMIWDGGPDVDVKERSDDAVLHDWSAFEQKVDSPVAVIGSAKDDTSKKEVDSVRVDANNSKGLRLNVKRFAVACVGTLAIIAGTVSAIGHFSSAPVPAPSPAQIAAYCAHYGVYANGAGSIVVEPEIPENYASLPKAEAMKYLTAKETFLTKRLADKSLSAAQIELAQYKLEVLHSMMAVP